MDKRFRALSLTGTGLLVADLGLPRAAPARLAPAPRQDLDAALAGAEAAAAPPAALGPGAEGAVLAVHRGTCGVEGEIHHQFIRLRNRDKITNQDLS